MATDARLRGVGIKPEGIVKILLNQEVKKNVCLTLKHTLNQELIAVPTSLPRFVLGRSNGHDPSPSRGRNPSPILFFRADLQRYLEPCTHVDYQSTFC